MILLLIAILNPFFILITKDTRKLELYQWKNGWKLEKSFQICQFGRGTPPKTKAGDEVTPDGLYHSQYVDIKNWKIGIDFPNKEDILRCGRKDIGGGIQIHGKCYSIGCVSLDDYDIKILCHLLRKEKNIPILILPSISEDFYKKIDEEKDYYKKLHHLLRLWKQGKILK